MYYFFLNPYDVKNGLRSRPNRGGEGEEGGLGGGSEKKGVGNCGVPLLSHTFLASPPPPSASPDYVCYAG